jgi:hypothetical protein
MARFAACVMVFRSVEVFKTQDTAEISGDGSRSEISKSAVGP